MPLCKFETWALCTGVVSVPCITSSRAVSLSMLVSFEVRGVLKIAMHVVLTYIRMVNKHDAVGVAVFWWCIKLGAVVYIGIRKSCWSELFRRTSLLLVRLHVACATVLIRLLLLSHCLSSLAVTDF